MAPQTIVCICILSLIASDCTPGQIVRSGYWLKLEVGHSRAYVLHEHKHPHVLPPLFKFAALWLFDVLDRLHGNFAGIGSQRAQASTRAAARLEAAFQATATPGAFTRGV
jgi:hypothetical protein